MLDMHIYIYILPLSGKAIPFAPLDVPNSDYYSIKIHYCLKHSGSMYSSLTILLVVHVVKHFSLRTRVVVTSVLSGAQQRF